MKISTMALYGIGQGKPQTMRIEGVLQGCKRVVKVLIDSGSTHYFVNQSLVDRYSLLLDKTDRVLWIL
jgi:hypothetical protein